MGRAEANLEQAGRDQWDLLGQVVVEVDAEEQVDEGLLWYRLIWGQLIWLIWQ